MIGRLVGVDILDVAILAALLRHKLALLIHMLYKASLALREVWQTLDDLLRMLRTLRHQLLQLFSGLLVVDRRDLVLACLV